MTVKFNPNLGPHAFARDIVIEVIRARGEHIAKSYPDATSARELASFITTLYDQTVEHFSKQE